MSRLTQNDIGKLVYGRSTGNRLGRLKTILPASNARRAVVEYLQVNGNHGLERYRLIDVETRESSEVAREVARIAAIPPSGGLAECGNGCGHADCQIGSMTDSGVGDRGGDAMNEERAEERREQEREAAAVNGSLYERWGVGTVSQVKDRYGKATVSESAHDLPAGAAREALEDDQQDTQETRETAKGETR